ncbi:aromatic acid exporter family protein [Ammoniphilus sp. CFH 90114]|uniref:FUSC family protein n=1 Tax=Ammoniphilus sp. CFH 90114 TaxID=2493665 RepID=UPI00100E7D0E|nr:aromatic acid exporter family protein [Ammoniphilus sp. CFH 90114]RXT08079.1 hypothetical protein EIZ39_11760 [Ammoniphilus sp. CFH 90114]
MFGRRTIKTAISVMASLFIANLLGLEPAVFAAVAAALSIQPTNKRSMRYAVEQVQANVAGALIGVIIAVFFGVHLYTVALAIIIVITLTNLFKWKDSIPLSIVTVIFIMEAPTEDFLYFSWNRFMITFVGVAVSGVINTVLLPPKYVTHLRRLYEQALKLLITYYSKWQADGVFHLKEMNALKDLINRTHQFEQWMREQSKSEVHPKGYYKGLYIESSKNDILSDFLLITEHYGRISWGEGEAKEKSRQQIKGLYEYVLAVMAHTNLPKEFQIDLQWWKETYHRSVDPRTEQSFSEIISALGRMEKRLRRYNRYVGKEGNLSLINEENRWFAWRWRW